MMQGNLFFCDVNGGDSRRALFLYQAASGQIVKVAAVGDPSPIGGHSGRLARLHQQQRKGRLPCVAGW